MKIEIRTERPVLLLCSDDLAAIAGGYGGRQNNQGREIYQPGMPPDRAPATKDDHNLRVYDAKTSGYQVHVHDKPNYYAGSVQGGGARKDMNGYETARFEHSAQRSGWEPSYQNSR